MTDAEFEFYRLVVLIRRIQPEARLFLGLFPFFPAPAVVLG